MSNTATAPEQKGFPGFVPRNCKTKFTGPECARCVHEGIISFSFFEFFFSMNISPVYFSVCSCVCISLTPYYFEHSSFILMQRRRRKENDFLTKRRREWGRCSAYWNIWLLPLRKKKKKTTTTTLTRMKEKEREIITNKKTKEITRLSLVLCWADYFFFSKRGLSLCPGCFSFLI